LRLFAARRLGDRTAAEDVAQEALRRALEAMEAGRIENSAALPGFLFQTALHICLHRSRSAGRERKALQRFGTSVGQGVEGPLTALISKERRSKVRQALEQIEPDDRRLLEMTYRDELSSEDIGRQLGLTAGAVRVRRHRAIRRMAELLGVTKTSDRELEE
jgi:RNA polymerase sigma-70 factor (ECF subfamily)